MDIKIPKDRLVKAYEDLRHSKKVLSQTDMGVKIGYNKSHFSELMNGRKPITNTLAGTIQSVFGISSEWLMDGKGPMFLKKQEEDSPGMVSEPDTDYPTEEDNEHPIDLSNPQTNNLMMRKMLEIMEKTASTSDKNAEAALITARAGDKNAEAGLILARAFEKLMGLQLEGTESKKALAS